jgi:hypothetical protein
VALACLVGKTAEGFGGLAGRLLSLRPLQYVGKISYGIYLYHLFVRAAFLEASRCLPLAPARQGACVVSDRYANDGGHGGPVLEVLGTAVKRPETSFPLSTRGFGRAPRKGFYQQELKSNSRCSERYVSQTFGRLGIRLVGFVDDRSGLRVAAQLDASVPFNNRKAVVATPRASAIGRAPTSTPLPEQDLRIEEVLVDPSSHARSDRPRKSTFASRSAKSRAQALSTWL